VVVVDEDTGRSGSSTQGRLGFKELVGDVGLGNVGLILALEVSRLARSSTDWHQLIDLCALTGTLIADSDGIYAPGDFNDRLLLGLKGTMSEAELHLIRERLDGGLRNKAARGELRMHLPVGFDRDEDGQIVLSADEQVRHAIERVFELWRRAGSARQVVGELIADGQLLPRRATAQRRVRWTRASYGAVHKLLTNPVYAGAFVYGRSRQEKRVDISGEVRCLPAPAPSWVCQLGGVPRKPRASARERETARRRWWSGERRQRVAAGPVALRALRAADAGRVLWPGRPLRALCVPDWVLSSRDRGDLPVARWRAVGSGDRGCVPGRGHPGRPRREHRGDR
jgi:DNA invertase Pin-like site-specific DNA recombinase